MKNQKNLKIYGIRFDDTDPKTMARIILNSEHGKNLSTTMLEFLRNIMEASFVWFEYASENSFENTNVGTFLIEVRTRERSIQASKSENSIIDIERQLYFTNVKYLGHFNLWTENTILIERRTKFENDFLNKEYAHKVYKKEWVKISEDGTIEKIKNYYLDY